VAFSTVSIIFGTAARSRGMSAANQKLNGTSDAKKLSMFPHGPRIAACLFAVAIAIILGTAAWWAFAKTPPGYSSGSAAASVLFLVVVVLVFARPALIMDDQPEKGGEPSTMRILSLAIVLIFCAIMLRNGWNDGKLPSLEQQGNWVWLVTAALGGKALQKYAEV
jgi:hypothetical protein